MTKLPRTLKASKPKEHREICRLFHKNPDTIADPSVVCRLLNEGTLAVLVDNGTRGALYFLPKKGRPMLIGYTSEQREEPKTALSITRAVHDAVSPGAQA